MARFNLPDIEFVTRDADEVETSMVNKLQELTGISLSDQDPRRKFLQSIAFGLTLQRNSIDYSAKQTLISYALDDFLDHRGESENVKRLEPKAAKTIMRYELTMATGEKQVIPKDSTVTPGNEIYFESLEDVTVTSDMTYIDIPVICTEVGEVGNGYLSGQVNQLVKPLPWVSKVYNLTTTSGGAEWESDDAYADRIRLSNEGYSTAGPEDAYIYHAKSANQLISDVHARALDDGTVEIIPLLVNGELPTQEILDQVLVACNDRKVRPLTDPVIASSPEVVSYDIDLTYYISSERESLSATIQAAVDEAVQSYISWQQRKLGRGIDPSELVFSIRDAGAKRVTPLEPANFVPLERYQVAKVNSVNVQFGGFIND